MFVVGSVALLSLRLALSLLDQMDGCCEPNFSAVDYVDALHEDSFMCRLRHFGTSDENDRLSNYANHVVSFRSPF